MTAEQADLMEVVGAGVQLLALLAALLLGLFVRRSIASAAGFGLLAGCFNYVLMALAARTNEGTGVIPCCLPVACGGIALFGAAISGAVRASTGFRAS